MADDRIVISSEPGISPEEVARRAFPVVFRGYDQDEVRRLLKKVADELANYRQREQELRKAIEEARKPAPQPELDEDAITAALGEETTRILRSAREAAADMRAKAEERVARMVQEADDHGARLRVEAENLLAKRVEEADEVAANIRAAAEADAKAMRDHADAELEAARARGKEMVAEAQAVRERVISDLARRRRAAQIQIEQLLGGRDRLLETYKAVRRTLDDVTIELDRAEDEARLAAEVAKQKAAAAPPDDGDLVELVERAPAPIDAPTAGSVPTAPFAPAPAPEISAPEQAPDEPPVEASAAPPLESEAPESPRPSLMRVQEMDEEEGVRIIGPVSATASPPPAPVEPVTDAKPTFIEADLVTERVSSSPEPPPVPAIEEALTPAPDINAEHPGSVEDLFARLRAERADAVSKAEAVLGATTAEQDGPEDASPDEEATAADSPPHTAAEAGLGDEDSALLVERDDALDPVASDLVRRLKRVLQDEQNEILDQLRKSKGRGNPEDVLPSASDQAGRYRDVAVEPLAEAAGKGALFAGAGSDADDVPVVLWAEALADELVGGLRDRIMRSLSAANDDSGSDAVDGLGAAYRQWKTDRIDQIARYHMASAFNQGVLAGAPNGTPLRWVFGDPGPCPDCDDNALAGPTGKGESYPTGQHHPPAHVGCGCLLVPVTDAARATG